MKKNNLVEKLRSVPHRPGVYIMRDRLHRIIYVGKAKDLRRRLSNYFTPSRQTRADLKTRALIDSIHDFEYHLVKSDAEAVLYEGKLIKEWRPKYNISFRDDKRFLLVRVHLGEPFPRFQLTRLRKEDGARYFGPFPNAGALRATLRTMIKKFGIRSCRPTEPTEKDFKHCLDHIIQNCSAPCVAGVTRDQYRARVLAACEFLEGKSETMITSMEIEMKKAAEQLDFEKATSLRNLLHHLQETTKPTRRFTRTSLPNSINPEADLIELQRLLSLPDEPEIMECFDISNISDTHIVASMVQFKNGVPHRKNYRRYRITTTHGQDDFASMAEVIRRRYSRLLREKKSLPNLIIVDGGKGQLSSACRELQALSLHDIPIIGLAKEFEEIYRPDSSTPLRIDKNIGALKMLQRIRDEAHRIANGYHELLLGRRVSESLLDDITGISDAKKKILLKKFGSVRRLRQAPEEEIAATKGIGKNLAEKIVRHFMNMPLSAN